MVSFAVVLVAFDAVVCVDVTAAVYVTGTITSVVFVVVVFVVTARF